MKIDNNSISGFFFNRLDWLVRFLYCKTPVLRDVLQKFLFSSVYASDSQCLNSRFEELKELLECSGIDIREKSVLELGPGNSYALAFGFLIHGARKYTMVDKFPRMFESDYQRRFLAREIEFFERVYDRDLSDVVDNCVVNKEKVVFFENGADRLKDIDDGSIDILLSNSVLEHVKNIDSAIDEMKRVIRPGGVMVHFVDLRDHYNFNNPLLFLKYSDRAWNTLLTKEGYSYTNRWRADEYLVAFESRGFEIVSFDKESMDPAAAIPPLHPSFESKDTNTLTIRVVCQKRVP